MKYVINRKDLYNLVWKEDTSFKTIADKYGMTQTNLRELCNNLRIPVPTTTVKKEMKYRKVYSKQRFIIDDTIPDYVDIDIMKIGMKSVITYFGYEKPNFYLLHLTKETKEEYIEKINKKINSISTDFKLAKNLSNQTKELKRLFKNKKLNYEFQSVHTTRNNYSYYKNDDKVMDFNKFSFDSIERIVEILALMEFVTSEFCGTLDYDYKIRVLNEEVNIEFYGMQKTIPHIITKQEQKEIDRYNKSHSYTKPRIRKEDFIFDGRLVLIISKSGRGNDKEYRFTEKEDLKLSDQLYEIAIALLEVSEMARVDRIRAEKQEANNKLRERAGEIYKELCEDELDRTKMLIKKAEDYYLSQKVLAYISYMELQSNEIDEEWIQWASNKVKWIATSKGQKNDIIGDKNPGEDILKIGEKYRPRW